MKIAPRKLTSIVADPTAMFRPAGRLGQLDISTEFCTSKLHVPFQNKQSVSVNRRDHAGGAKQSTNTRALIAKTVQRIGVGAVCCPNGRIAVPKLAAPRVDGLLAD